MGNAGPRVAARPLVLVRLHVHGGIRPESPWLRGPRSCWGPARLGPATNGAGAPGRISLPGVSEQLVTPEKVRVGVLGCGNVGAAGAADRRAVEGDRRPYRHRLRSRARPQPVAATRLDVDPAILTNDAASIVNDPDIDVVVELDRRYRAGSQLISTALRAGKPVITGNKELLANVGVELFELAEASGVDLLFEAAVAGAIPIVRALRESLHGEPIRRVMGIVNGTTNYILTKMTFEGASYGEALAEAQRLGFAERDPTADVEGYDAGAKAAIMASIASGSRVVAGNVYHEGISGVTGADIAVAKRLGYVVKLLAIIDLEDSGEVAVRVHPAMVPESHPLASVRDTTPCSSRARPPAR